MIEITGEDMELVEKQSEIDSKVRLLNMLIAKTEKSIEQDMANLELYKNKYHKAIEAQDVQQYGRPSE